jgi:hypothetical protein
MLAVTTALEGTKRMDLISAIHAKSLVPAKEGRPFVGAAAIMGVFY